MPSSPYVICLGDAERAELESLSRRATAPFRLVLRARDRAAGGWRRWRTARSPSGWASARTRPASGGAGTASRASRGWPTRRALAGRACSPPGRGRGQGPGVRDARRERDAAGPLDLPRAGPSGGGQRHRSRALGRPPCAAGSLTTPSSPGSTGRGSSPATRASLSRPPASWTSTSGNGKDSRSATTSTCSAPTRNPASRPACASTSRSRRGRAGRCAPRASTTASAPSPTWPPTTSTAPRSSAGARPPPASSRSPRSRTR